MTKDTFKGTSSNSGILNRYAYCEGDPVNFIDPTGYARKNIQEMWLEANSEYVDDGHSDGWYGEYIGYIDDGHSDGYIDGGDSLENMNNALTGTLGTMTQEKPQAAKKTATKTIAKSSAKALAGGALTTVMLINDLNTDINKSADLRGAVKITIGSAVATALLGTMAFVFLPGFIVTAVGSYYVSKWLSDYKENKYYRRED